MGARSCRPPHAQRTATDTLAASGMWHSLVCGPGAQAAQIRHGTHLDPRRDCQVGPWLSCVTPSKTDVAQRPSAAAPPEERMLRRISSFFSFRQNLQPWLVVVYPKLLNCKIPWTLTAFREV